jgi:hypothetical protein
MAQAQDHDEITLTREEYLMFQQIQEQFNQRVMGLGEKRHQIVSKLIYDKSNAEEFLSKFPHIASAYKVDRIFYTDYGLHRSCSWAIQVVRPGWHWIQRHFRVLEKHVNKETWSLA